MDTADKLNARLDQFEAERLILTIELRNALVRAAKDLLPEAIRQAKPKRARGKSAARPASPALLRLISRLAMRRIEIEPSRQR
jgi:anti-sigma factor RsiW